MSAVVLHCMMRSKKVSVRLKAENTTRKPFFSSQMARTHPATPLLTKRHHQSANLNFWFIAWEFRPAIPAVFFAKARLRSAADRPAAAIPADDRAFRFPESLAFPVSPAFPAAMAAGGR